MSVGPGRIERRVLKVLEYERQENNDNLHRFVADKGIFYECDSDVKGIVGLILNGCNHEDWAYHEENMGKVYRSVYQSVCRAIRTLERKGLVKSAIIPGSDISGYGWSKAITLIKSGDKHLETTIKNEGVNT